MVKGSSVIPSAAPAAAATGWWDGLKQHVADALNKINLSLADVTQIVVFFGIGFFGGFFLRKYGRFLLLLIIGFVLLFVLFDYFDFLMINWAHVQAVTGINPHCTLVQCWHGITGYVRVHLLASISTLVGFLIGYGVG